MYLISRLSKPSVAFINKVSGMTGNKKEVFPLAAAFVIARRLAIPAEEVEDIATYFNLNCRNAADRQINELNELLPFNYKEAQGYIQAFYKFRYISLHPRSIPLAFHQETAVVDFFGLSEFFNNTVFELIKANPEALTTIISGLSTMYVELDALNKQKQVQESEGKDSYVAP